jgi:hypothetical protein
VSIQPASAQFANAVAVRRRLLLIWQNPTSRRFSRVAELNQLVNDRFSFAYLPIATEDPEFFPLDEFPDLNKVYVSDELPVFFSNRVMSAERASYGQYLERLGLNELTSVDVPVEVLIRTGGTRATDTFHVVDHPVDSDSRFISRFFVSGSRHIPEAQARIAALHSGAELELSPEPTNSQNAHAVLIDVLHGDSIGWVPDWLCGEITAMASEGYAFGTVAERINLDAPAHLQVLCRIEAMKIQSVPKAKASKSAVSKGGHQSRGVEFF